MELYQLRYFEQVATRESLSGAARELHVSQPALSKAISKLEEELGVALFDRSGNRLKLNNKGNHYLLYVQRILREVDDSRASLRLFSNNEGETLKVVVYGPQKEALDCTLAFLKKNPMFNLLFVVKHDDEVLIGEWESEIIFYQTGNGMGKIAGIPYGTRTFSVVLPESHPLALNDNVSLADMSHESFIFLNNSPFTYEQSYRLCRQAGFYPFVRIVTSNKQALLEFVRAGLGIGILDSPTMRKVSGVKSFELSDAEVFREQRFASRNVSTLSPAARRFLDFIFTYFDIPEDEIALATFDGN